MSFFGTRRQVETSPRPPTEPPPRLDPPQPPADVPQPVGFETVLGANSVMEGTLRSAANVRLDGTFTGTLEIGGNVLIGETAKITADVNARNISIAGAVRGNVTGKKVQLLRTGRVWGDIRAQALTTEEGAFIDGKIAMVGHELSPAPASEVEPEPVFDQDPARHAATTSDTDTERIIPELEPVGLGAVADDPEAELPPETDETTPFGESGETEMMPAAPSPDEETPPTA